MKRILSLFIVAALMCGFLSVNTAGQPYVAANAASIEMNIQILRGKFPDGKFWNHKTNANHNHVGVYSSCRNSYCNNPDGWTDHPCSNHNGAVGVGGYDCNNFDDAIQCMGFAMKLFYDVHGVTVRNTQVRYDKYNVSVGDYIRVNGDAHSALVIGRNGNTVTVAECNLYGAGNECRIRWDYAYDISAIDYFCHSDSVGTSLHQCSYGSNHICSGCGGFDPASVAVSAVDLTFSIKTDGAVDHTGPYGACAAVNSYTKGVLVTAVEKIVNAHGHTWYKLTNGRYIYDEYLKAYTINYTDIAAGDYRIVNFSTMKYLIVDEGKNAERQNVSVWDYAPGATEEKWAVTKDGLGYVFTTKLGSRVLNPYADVISPGNNVNILTAVSGDITQHWKLELVMGGFVIRNAANLSCVLTVKDGHNVILDTYRSGDLTQVWQFEAATDCSHDWIFSAVTQKPTCSSTGLAAFTCSVCNTQRHELIPENDVHVYDSGVITRTGTCKTEGEILYTCLECEHSYTQSTGYGTIHGNLTLSRSGKYNSVSNFTCKACGAGYSYDLGVKNVTATPNGKNTLNVKIEFIDSRNVRNGTTLNYPATAVSPIHPGGILNVASGKIKSQTMKGNIYTAEIEYTDAALAQLVGDAHSFYIKFENKDEPQNKYGYVQVIYNWQQGKYKTLKVGKAFDVQTFLGVKLDGYYLDDYDTSVVEYKNGSVTAKAAGRAYLVFINNMTGVTTGVTVIVEDEKKPEPEKPAVSVVRGDVDGDNKVSASDARNALRASVGLDKLSEKQRLAADIDKDNKITAADARYILRYSVGLIDKIWK